MGCAECVEMVIPVALWQLQMFGTFSEDERRLSGAGSAKLEAFVHVHEKTKTPARPGRESLGEVVSRCPIVENFQSD